MCNTCVRAYLLTMLDSYAILSFPATIETSDTLHSLRRLYIHEDVQKEILNCPVSRDPIHHLLLFLNPILYKKQEHQDR